MFEVSLVVALLLLQQCNNTTPAQQLGGASLLYSLGNATMSTSVNTQEWNKCNEDVTVEMTVVRWIVSEGWKREGNGRIGGSPRICWTSFKSCN
jgi:hypothetical protein